MIYIYLLIVKIIYNIFNHYTDSTLVYLDDVLVFLKNISQYFDHLEKFHTILKENGLVVSAKKIKLFQTKVGFLGFEIFQGTIAPMSRSIEFVDKFPNKIKDKTQLLRFLGCVNYVSDFIPNLRTICEPFYKKLRKKPQA